MVPSGTKNLCFLIPQDCAETQTGDRFYSQNKIRGKGGSHTSSLSSSPQDCAETQTGDRFYSQNKTRGKMSQTLSLSLTHSSFFSPQSSHSVPIISSICGNFAPSQYNYVKFNRLCCNSDPVCCRSWIRGHHHGRYPPGWPTEKYK